MRLRKMMKQTSIKINRYKMNKINKKLMRI